MSTDSDWEKWGKQNPYFGVLSDEKFSGKKLAAAKKKNFYDSGRGDIVALTASLKKISGGGNTKISIGGRLWLRCRSLNYPIS